MTTATISTDFVPADLDASRWENLQPLYQALLDRELKCSGCLESLLLDRSELDAAANEARANLYIRMTCFTNDEQAKNAYLQFVENVEPKLKKIGFELDRKVAGCPFTRDLDPKRYEVLLRNTQADVELFREENIPLQTADTKLGQQYDEICGAMTVMFRGEEKTLPQMVRYLEETDRATREEAWRGLADRRAQDHEAISGIFDQMIELRHRMARNAGFENYRDYMFKAHHRFDYTPAECEAFHRAAEEVCVPVFRKLNAERAAALRLSPAPDRARSREPNSAASSAAATASRNAERATQAPDGDTLRPWDLAVDIRGRDPLRPFEKADELVERSSRLFHKLDPKLGRMFDSLRGGGCLDLDSRKGKAPGGYQYNRDRIRKPFIFMNAAGLNRDLETMIHEAGHAFHSIYSQDDPLVWYRHSPTEFAEVASMSMELFAHPYLEEFYSEEDAARSKRVHLEALSRMLPWIATIDAFQHWLYTNPEHTREQRTAQWIELDERFGPAVDWTGLEAHRAIMWQRQLHLFTVPFYYIEYGIAQLGALQLWLQSRRDEKKALANYEKAMSLGGSRPLPELFAAADLTFDFGPATMKRLMDEVERELASLPQ